MTEFNLILIFGGLIVGACAVVCLFIVRVVRDVKSKSENRKKLLERLRWLS